MNPTAAAGFGSAGAVYDAARPTYPPAAVDRVVSRFGVDEASVVVDVAAGTGKLTHLLPGRVLAVEPLDDMRRHLRVPAVAGVVQALPLRAASAHVVTVAQAFHWFERDVAAAEIRRVLRPGGGLAMLWNTRDDSVGWVAELDRIIHAHDDGSYVKIDNATPLPGFTPIEHDVLAFGQPQTVDGVVGRALSTSYIAARPDVHAQVERDVRALLDGFPATFELPHVTDVFTCRSV